MSSSLPILHLLSTSPEQTQRFAMNLATLLRGGDLLSLKGTLGAGKTHFAQGLALGLGVGEETYVTSPTFTFINQYEAKTASFQGTFFHLDLYRLEEQDELFEIGYYEILRSDNIAAVEWWDRFPEEIPPRALTVEITQTGDQKRKIQLLSDEREWAQRLLKQSWSPLI